MKTIGDLERWLKQDPLNTFHVTGGGSAKDFVVTMNGYRARSRTVEGAVDNAMEEMRRADSGSSPMRDAKPASQPAPTTSTSSTAPAYVPPFQASPSISQAAQQAYQQQAVAQYPTCPKCSMLSIASMPNVNGSGNAHICMYGHTWSTP